MTVSVVIPVYNVKPYLRRCVQSVLRQTYRDLEVIIVDDGSNDGSAELCDALGATDKRIIVIHQQNQGLSAARNTGIRNATGTYIMFLDSDDAWLSDNGLEELMQANQASSDLIAFKNVDFWPKGHRSHNEDYDLAHINELPDAQAVFSFLVRTQTFRMSACFIIVRKEILINHHIFFPEHIISEDLTWSLKLWQHIQTVVFTNLEFYGYHHRRDSISTTTANTIEAYRNYDAIFNYWNKQCENECENAEAIRVFMADMWVSRGYNYHLLPTSDKPEALFILGQHASLLNYAETRKSKRTSCVFSFLGIKSTVALLGLYWQMRMIIKRHNF